MRRWAWLVVLVAACEPPATPPPQAATTPTRTCRYEVTFEAPVLGVTVRCDGSEVRGFIASEESIAHLVQGWTLDGDPAPRVGARFGVPAGMRYRLDLNEAAREVGDMDVALGFGGAWLTAASTWLLRPDPIGRDAQALITVEGAFASGLDRTADGARAMPAWTIPAATYAAFGDFARESIPLGESELEVVTLPGAFAIPALERRRWVVEAATEVSRFWRGFPVPRASLFLGPVPGRADVVRGKVVGTGGPSVALLLGAEADPTLLRNDWVLVHELFHLGVPSFAGEGEWLDEGLATYFEPLIRARAGWRSEEQLWQEWASGMQRGLGTLEIEGLERAHDPTGVYWGGALIALLADVEARRQSQGQRGLEDGLRAVLEAGGDATVVWRVDAVVTAIDGALGHPAMAPLVARHRDTPAPVDLETLLRDLGLRWGPDGELQFDESAPLAAVRRSILKPAG